jgi:glycine/D-amino acid oxidase-like deaminating enzyme
MKVDFLIIGQGLAGSLLAWELIGRGCNVVVVDSGFENASQIAAGLINPITGMRFVKSAEVDTLLPAAKRYYAHLEDFFQEQFFIEKPMLRIFSDERELISAQKRLNNPDYRGYMDQIKPKAGTMGNLLFPFGYLEQTHTGFLLTRPLLNRLKAFFISRNCYLQADFSYPDLEFKPTLRWGDFSPRQIIFCEGFRSAQNPWFRWLPFQPVKGEILTLQHQAVLPDKILNYGNWLIPLSDHLVRIGATFDRGCQDTLPTEQGKNELLTALSRFVPRSEGMHLINHQANIRPCTPDRHPFVGRHPEQQQLAIFNGFGAKGSLQIPWYSIHFADSLLTDTPILPSANLLRYFNN